MDRFQQPREDPWWCIRHTYILEGLRLIPRDFEVDCFATSDEIDFDVWTISYDIEVLKNCEPDIASIRAERFDRRHYHKEEVKGALLALAESFLRDNHERWAKMRDDALENGERVYVKEERAA